MTLLSRVSLLVAKIETSIGTAISVSTGDATFNVMNLKFTPAVEFQTRAGQGSFSKLPGVPTTRSAKMTFSIEVAGDGSGGIPAWASTFLPACGWVASAQVYSPKSEPPGTNVKTLTMYRQTNGVIEGIRGACGTFKIVFPTARIARFDFEFTGLFINRTDGSILAPTYTTIAPQRVGSTVVSIGSWNPRFEEMSIDAGNAVILIEDPGDPTGYRSALISDRNVVGKLNPSAEPVATVDNQGIWLARTQQALSLVLNDGTDKITFAAPKLQITNMDNSDRNGQYIDEIDFACNKSAVGGNDEFTITFAAGP